tara:strand:- start:9661 stop:10431 length:771 start_codon:yes stop_codon:yes gene_type:complete
MATIIRIKNFDPDKDEQESLAIDAVISQTVVSSQKVSKFPVEKGFSISDNAFKNNKRINVTGVVSEATLQAGQDSVVISGLDQSILSASDIPNRSVIKVLGNELLNKVPDNIFTRNLLKQAVVTQSDVAHTSNPNQKDIISKARTFLEKVFSDSTLLVLDTVEEDFEDLVITTINFDKKRPQKGVLNFTLVMEELRFVNTQNATVAANLKPEVAEEGEEEVVLGTVEGKTVNSKGGGTIFQDTLTKGTETVLKGLF